MDKEGLGRLILASEDSMYHVAKTLLREDADCADAIQEAIVKAFSKIETLRQDSFAKTWLIRIVINECYTILRRRKTMVSLEEYQSCDLAAPERDYSDLYEALEQLPERARLMITLFYLEGYSIREIAGMLDVTESTVKNGLARARMRLRQELEGTVKKGRASPFRTPVRAKG